MKAKANKRQGFTIVELLTVMSIMVLLMSILLPAFSRVRRYAKKVKQKAQFKSIDMSLELYNAKWDGYPESDYDPYTFDENMGAAVLSSSLLGRDLLGYTPVELEYGNYPAPLPANSDISGRETYLEIENANAYKLKCLYNSISYGTKFEESHVLCDIYTTNTYQNPDSTASDPDKMNGEKVGMPILYFKANASGSTHPVQTSEINDHQNIYNHLDNDAIVEFGLGNRAAGNHPMDDTAGNPLYFYDEILNDKIASFDRPYKSDSFILMSAGFDGLYGTKDDIFNFGN